MSGAVDAGWSREYEGRFAEGQTAAEVRRIVRSLTYQMSARSGGGYFGGLVALRTAVARGEVTLPGHDRADALVLIAGVIAEHEAAWDAAIDSVSSRHEMRSIAVGVLGAAACAALAFGLLLVVEPWVQSSAPTVEQSGPPSDLHLVSAPIR